MIRTIRKAALLKFVSWVIFSPTLAMAADNLHVANSPQLTRLYDRAAATFLSDTEHIEYAYTIDRDGTVSPIMSMHDFNRNTVTVDRDTVGIVHTHPRSVSSEPSPEDRDLATKSGLDNYVLSAHELWVAHPFAKRVEKIGEVEFKGGKLVVRF
jgi:proteasome lid subunit RPN8/RPN11